MCETCENEEPNLREIWAAADKKAKDWRDAGEEKLLRQMHDAREGLLPTDVEGPHHMGNVTELLHMGWELMIAHPPCTHLAVSGSRWFKDKVMEQADALEFVRMLMDAPIPRIAIENPISVISSRIRKPDQIIQPWQFGHGETKATCLWLKGLPKLTPTNVVEGRDARVHRMPPGPDRWKERSRTYSGVAEAMAAQWGFGP